MWIILAFLAVLYLARRPKAADTDSPAAGPNSETIPELSPARPLTVEEEVERQVKLLMDQWRNEPNGGYR